MIGSAGSSGPVPRCTGDWLSGSHVQGPRKALGRPDQHLCPWCIGAEPVGRKHYPRVTTPAKTDSPNCGTRDSCLIFPGNPGPRRGTVVTGKRGESRRCDKPAETTRWEEKGKEGNAKSLWFGFYFQVLSSLQDNNFFPLTMKDTSPTSY